MADADGGRRPESVFRRRAQRVDGAGDARGLLRLRIARLGGTLGIAERRQIEGDGMKARGRGRRQRRASRAGAASA
jgi:hypothetical protein